MAKNMLDYQFFLKGEKMTSEEMIEKFQCPGCMSGGDTHCGHYSLNENYGISCSSHYAGTMIFGIGKILLGLPKGFNRIGPLESEYQKVYLRLWLAGQKPVWDKFNVPVWAMVEDGFLFTRTYSPRNNKTNVDIIEGGTLEDIPSEFKIINVGKFKDEID